MEADANDNQTRIPPVIGGQNQNDGGNNVYSLDEQLNAQAIKSIDEVNKQKAFFKALQTQLAIMRNFLQGRSKIIDQGLLTTAFSGLLFCPEMDDKIKIKLTDDKEKETIIALIEEANKDILNNKEKEKDNKKKQTKEKLINYKITKKNELKINVHDIFRLCYFSLINNQNFQEGFSLLGRANKEIEKHDHREQLKEKILNWIAFGITIASTISSIVVETLVSMEIISLPMMTLPFSLPIIGASIPILVTVTTILSTLPLIIKIIAKIIKQTNRQEHGKDAKMDCFLNNNIMEKIENNINRIEEVISNKAKKGLFNELKEQEKQNNLTNNLDMNNNININNNNDINNVNYNNVGNLHYNNNQIQNDYPSLTEINNNINYNNNKIPNDNNYPPLTQNNNNMQNNQIQGNNYPPLTQNNNNNMQNNQIQGNDYPPLTGNNNNFNIFGNQNFNYDYNNIPPNNQPPLYNGQNQYILQGQNNGNNNIMQNNFG